MVFDDVQAFILGVLARPMRLGFTNPHAVPAHIASVRRHALPGWLPLDFPPLELPGGLLV